MWVCVCRERVKNLDYSCKPFATYGQNEIWFSSRGQLEMKKIWKIPKGIWDLTWQWQIWGPRSGREMKCRRRASMCDQVPSGVLPAGEERSKSKKLTELLVDSWVRRTHTGIQGSGRAGHVTSVFIGQGGWPAHQVGSAPRFPRKVVLYLQQKTVACCSRKAKQHNSTFSEPSGKASLLFRKPTFALARIMCFVIFESNLENFMTASWSILNDLVNVIETFSLRWLRWSLKEIKTFF